MKTTRRTIPVMLLLLLTTSVMAQESDSKSNPSDVVVLEKSWHKEFIYPGRDPNPLRPNEDHIRQTRVEKRYIRNREYDLPNQPTEPRMPIPVPRPLPASSEPRPLYVYKFSVKNNGAKRIKALDWEYQFLHPDNQNVMGSRRIVSRVKLSPGKTEMIQVRLLQQPARIVSVDQLDKKYRDQFTERLIIHRINYTDGSVWKRTP